MRRFTVPVLLLLLLGATAFGLAELVAGRKQAAALASLEKARADLEKRIRDLEELNRELASQQAPVAAAGETAVVADEESRAEAPPVSGQGETAGRNRGRPDFERFAAVLNDPEVRRLMTVQLKATLDSRYAALFKSMHLGPQDLENFKNLLVEKQSAIADVISAARKEGLDPRTNRDAIRQLVQSTQAEVDVSIRSTLGEAAYAQYQQFETTQPQRITVTQLGQRLSYSTSPLSDTQTEQLVGILTSTGTSGKTTGGNNTGGGKSTLRAGGFGSAGQAAKITDATVTQAQGVLTAPQLAALRSLQQEQLAAAQLARQMSEARQRNHAATTAAQPATQGTGGK